MSTLEIAGSIIRRALSRPDEAINLWLWGPPGVGKSTLVRAEAEKLGLSFIDFRGVTCEPTDVRGFPTVENGVVRWARPEFLPSEGEGILFLDELGQAPGLVQAALLQLTLDRRCGEHEIPAGWRIIAASNRLEDRAGVGRLNSALLDRFVHLEVEVSAEEWSRWALDHEIAPEVRAFINFRPGLLSDFDPKRRVSPTPRSWEVVSRLRKLFEDERLLQDALSGTVGEGPAAEFLAFCRSYRELPSLEEICRDPEAVEIPRDPGLLYALAGLGAGHGRSGTDDTIAALARLAIRLPLEFTVIALRDMLQVGCGQILRIPQVRSFLKENRDVLVAPADPRAAA